MIPTAANADAEPRQPDDRQEETAGASVPRVIVARPGRYYRNARYLMMLVCFVAAGWFAYDGWARWPREDAEDRAHGYENVRHGSLNIRLQKQLAAALPLLGA